MDPSASPPRVPADEFEAEWWVVAVCVVGLVCGAITSARLLHHGASSAQGSFPTTASRVLLCSQAAAGLLQVTVSSPVLLLALADCYRGAVSLVICFCDRRFHVNCLRLPQCCTASLLSLWCSGQSAYNSLLHWSRFNSLPRQTANILSSCFSVLEVWSINGYLGKVNCGNPGVIVILVSLGESLPITLSPGRCFTYWNA